MVSREQDARPYDQLVARAVHDLRTPLSSIVTWLRILRADALSERGLRALEMSERAARELGDMLATFDDALQLAEGTLSLQHRPLDLVAVARAALDGLREPAAARGVSFEWRAQRPVARVRGDEPRLHRCLARLLAHALARTTPPGPIAVELETDGGEARLLVSAPGVSFPPSARSTDEPDGWPDVTGPGGQVLLDQEVAARIVQRSGGSVRTGGAEGVALTVSLPLDADGAPSPVS